MAEFRITEDGIGGFILYDAEKATRDQIKKWCKLLYFSADKRDIDDAFDNLTRCGEELSNIDRLVFEGPYEIEEDNY